MNRTVVSRAWDAVMNEEQNSMRHYPLTTAHLMMQVLAWMWSIIFSLAVGGFLVFGITMIAHTLILAGVFVTVAVFQIAERSNQ